MPRTYLGVNTYFYTTFSWCIYNGLTTEYEWCCHIRCSTIKGYRMIK